MLHEAMCNTPRSDGSVECGLCAHRCIIRPGHTGICRVRRNDDGVLYSTVYGQPVALHVDPIEKKPLRHFLPGTMTFSVATVGCNFRCEFCQNWQISQPASSRTASFRNAPLSSAARPQAATVSPAEIVGLAQENRCPSVSYTYTEPTVYFEYAYETARIAHSAGLKNIFVTNGFMTREALQTISPYLDAANVDLKSFSDSFYRKHCKGRLDPVLETIRLMKELGVWVEVTTLVIPSENDSKEELRQIANFLASIAREIPWHVSRFHPDYRMTDHEITPRDTLSLAADIGHSAGLTSVYVGNVP